MVRQESVTERNPEVITLFAPNLTCCLILDLENHKIPKYLDTTQQNRPGLKSLFIAKYIQALV